MGIVNLGLFDLRPKRFQVVSAKNVVEMLGIVQADAANHVMREQKPSWFQALSGVCPGVNHRHCDVESFCHFHLLGILRLQIPGDVAR